MLHKKPLHTRNTRSSSYTMPLLNRPAHSKVTLGDRSSSFASSYIWNSIPNDVRCAPSLSSFKSNAFFAIYLYIYRNNIYIEIYLYIYIACLRYHCHSSTAPSYVTDMLHKKALHTHKIACLCYHCHSSSAPSYVNDMLHKKRLHTRITRFSSYTMPLLNRPAHSKVTLGDLSFSFASSSVWNSIPNDVRCAPSLSSFKSRLRTYLFRSVYKD